MNSLSHTRTFRHTLPALALLLTLSLGAKPAMAQPSASDADFGPMIEEMDRSLSNPAVRAELTRAQWDAYTDNVEDALASGHDGVQQGALRMMVLYGDNLAISRAGVYDAVRIYRNHEDDRLRRMAVVALGKIKHPCGLDVLKRSARFEGSPSVRQTILAVLAASGTIELGPAKVGG